MSLFSCLKCGTCCRSLLRRINIGTTKILGGLQVHPNEKTRLEREAAKRKLPLFMYPQLGLKSKGKARQRPDEILTYQVANNVCPFITETNRCQIYDVRPLTCRAYPIVTDFGGMSVENTCLYVVKNYGLNAATLTNPVGFPKMSTEVLCYFQKQRYLHSKTVTFVYDLLSFEWIALLKIVKESEKVKPRMHFVGTWRWSDEEHDWVKEQASQW